VDKNPSTRVNRPPTPGISSKWVSRLFFVILWPVETVDKNQFYTSQNALKLTRSNVEFQTFIGVDTSFRGKGRGWKGESEGEKRKGEGEGRVTGGEEREGE